MEGYAGVMAELAAAGDARADVLARHGLDEASWDALDEAFQAELSAAMAAPDDEVPAVLSAYAAAYEAAQRALGPTLSIERFAEVTRLVSASGDVRAALARVGVTLAEYVRATEHWPRRMAEDDAIERRFRAALARRDPDV
jgi:hypothetical protein